MKYKESSIDFINRQLNDINNSFKKSKVNKLFEERMINKNIKRATFVINYGCTIETLNDKAESIRNHAVEYFNKCAEILELEEVAYEFTPEQATLLELNGMKVNPRAIKKQ